MEGIDRKLIAALYESNFEFKKLYDEHLKIHDQLAKLENRKYLSPEESLTEKELKMKKLKGRERLIEIIDSSHQAESPQYSELTH